MEWNGGMEYWNSGMPYFIPHLNKAYVYPDTAQVVSVSSQESRVGDISNSVGPSE